MTGSRKKVVIRLFPAGLLRGYVPPAGFVQQQNSTTSLVVLDLDGRVQAIPIDDVKTLSFVREFNVADDFNPERLPRRTFLARPRTEGLWIRIVLRDDEQIEGLAPLDLTLANGLADDQGIQFTPPDVRGNTLRMYVPRHAMASLQIIAVVTTPTRRRALEALSRTQADEDQFSLQLEQDVG